MGKLLRLPLDPRLGARRVVTLPPVPVPDAAAYVVRSEAAAVGLIAHEFELWLDLDNALELGIELVRLARQAKRKAGRR